MLLLANTIVQKGEERSPLSVRMDVPLLSLYLSLSPSRREKLFADTSRSAEIAGVSQRTVQLWIESGLVRAIRIGRRYRVDLDSLREFLESGNDD